MPSWNIHIAHAEGLLLNNGAVSHAVCDRNAFLFGSVVPDIFVGYMVPGVVEPIPYRITHFALQEPIPKPREDEFWDTYVVPLLKQAQNKGVPSANGETFLAEPTTKKLEIERLNRVHYPQRYEGAPPVPEPPATEFSCSDAAVRQSLLDLTLGVWAHLVADNIWNTRVNEYLDSIGDTPSEQFRIKKQGDFDWFGKTLAIDSVPRATERLYRAAEAFPQYPISTEYVLKTIGVMHEVVRSNPGDPYHPPYRLLTDEFFSRVFTEVNTTTNAFFTSRA